jgi:adenosylmethionine-8-amino-7-oxononanoate aminotransferase
VASKAIEIYVREELAQCARKTGQHILARLQSEFMSIPCVGEVNGLGLFGGIEIVANKETRAPFPAETRVMERIRSSALERGLFFRTTSITTSLSDRVVWSPPLTITIQQADRALDILKSVLVEIEPDVQDNL